MSGKRMLHKNICTSVKINSISEGAECLYYRLLTVSDDLGMFYRDARVVQVQCFPRRHLSTKTIERRLLELENAGLVDKFVQDKVEILTIIGWEKFQFLRKDRQKFSFFGIPSGIPSGIPPDIPEGKGKDKGEVCKGTHTPLGVLLREVSKENPGLWHTNPNHYRKEWEDWIRLRLSNGETEETIRSAFRGKKYVRDILIKKKETPL